MTALIASVAGLALWIAWCFLVVQQLVPAVQRHLTIYAQLIAIVLCMMPAAAVILGVAAVRARKE